MSGAAHSGKPLALVALLGFATFVALHGLFLALWADVFARVPWPGYEESTRRGLVEPWFVHTPRSLWLTRATFFATALVVALRRRSAAWQAALALWAGAALAIGGTYATTSVQSLPWGRLGFVLYPFRVLLPILLGTALAQLARRTLRRGTT